MRLRLFLPALLLLLVGTFARGDLGVPIGFACASGTCSPPASNALGAASHVLSGTTFTLGAGTGACATTSTLTGGSAGGSFLCTGTAGASTQVVNLPTVPTGFHGWACWANDDTSKVGWAAGGNTTSATTLSGTIATTSDKVVFGCVVY